jgi:predicted double-glycine peptidase
LEAVPVDEKKGVSVCSAPGMHLLPFFEAASVAGLGYLGYRAGRWCAQLPAPYWTAGYFAPLGLVALLWLGRFGDLELTAPMSWLLAGRTEIALAAPIITLILSTPLSRLASEKTRRLVVLFMIVLTSLSAVWPFLAPVVNRNELQQLQTRVDRNGICLQGTDYTCGPAAAVTILRGFGLPAEESQLALLAGTSSGTGTPPDLLRDALLERYAGTGLGCDYRHFKDMDELRGAGPAVVLMKYGLFVDHYVALLQIDAKDVIVGDPLFGVRHLSHWEFKRLWRRTGLVFRYEPSLVASLPVVRNR